MSHAWRNVVPVNALVLAALLVGLLNNSLIAASFGLTRRVDAFYAAMMLPNLFMFLCVDYLGKNFLPVLLLAKKEGEASASQMVSTVVTIIAILATATTLLLAASGNLLFALLLPGFDESESALVMQYFLIMAPAIVLMAINAFHEYVCQYDEDFAAVFAIRIALPGMNLAAIVLLGPALAEYCLPIGYLAGHVVVFVLMARRARYRYRPRITVRRHLEATVFTNSAIVMSTGFLARTKSIVINMLASTLGDGAISALAFATKLTEPLERAAFSGARMFMFSRAARLYADNNVRELGQLYAVGIRAGFLLLVPALWWIILNSETLVEVVFARGEFTPRMTTLVAATLIALAPSVLFSGLGQLLASAFYAMGRVRVPALIMPLGMLAFVAAALPLSRTLGAQGIALATTISAMLVFGALFTYLSRAVSGLSWDPIALHLLGYTALGGTLMGGVMLALQQLDLSPLVTAVASLPAGTVLYVAVLAVSRNRTLGAVLRVLRPRVSV
jgi:putative peptidoglycan lipid II flippase